jgi:hypothetical protein
MLASFADDTGSARLYLLVFLLEREVGLDKASSMSLICCAGFRSWQLYVSRPGIRQSRCSRVSESASLTLDHWMSRWRVGNILQRPLLSLEGASGSGESDSLKGLGHASSRWSKPSTPAGPNSPYPCLRHNWHVAQPSNQLGATRRTVPHSQPNPRGSG